MIWYNAPPDYAYSIELLFPDANVICAAASISRLGPSGNVCRVVAAFTKEIADTEVVKLLEQVLLGAGGVAAIFDLNADSSAVLHFLLAVDQPLQCYQFEFHMGLQRMPLLVLADKASTSEAQSLAMSIIQTSMEPVPCTLPGTKGYGARLAFWSACISDSLMEQCARSLFDENPGAITFVVTGRYADGACNAFLITGSPFLESCRTLRHLVAVCIPQSHSSTRVFLRSSAPGALHALELFSRPHSLLFKLGEPSKELRGAKAVSVPRNHKPANASA